MNSEHILFTLKWFKSLNFNFNSNDYSYCIIIELLVKDTF